MCLRTHSLLSPRKNETKKNLYFPHAINVSGFLMCTFRIIKTFDLFRNKKRYLLTRVSNFNHWLKCFCLSPTTRLDLVEKTLKNLFKLNLGS